MSCFPTLLACRSRKSASLPPCSPLSSPSLALAWRNSPPEQLTCRGAWQCTQHPAVEALAITLTLLPAPGPIMPPEKEKARRRRGAAVAAAGNRGAQRHGNGCEPGAGAGGGSGGGGGGGAGGGKEGWAEWVCARCTCLNAERRCVRRLPILLAVGGDTLVTDFAAAAVVWVPRLFYLVLGEIRSPGIGRLKERFKSTLVLSVFGILHVVCGFRPPCGLRVAGVGPPRSGQVDVSP